MSPYVELHARSGFSFLEGASVPEELAGACAQFDMPAMALVDRNGVYGAPRFHMAAKKAGVRAHVGSEISCTNGLSYPLLAETREGYRNLCRLVTRMKLRAKKGEGAATLEEIAEFARGLICITRHPDERLLEIFGRGHLYAELERHYNREEEARNQQLIDHARRLGIPLVATNGVAYSVPAQRELLDVFTCVRRKTTLARAGRLLERNGERYVKTPAVMARLFADLPEAIANTLRNLLRAWSSRSPIWATNFRSIRCRRAETMAGFLRKRADEGARRRYQPYHERARRQIERELALIEKLKLEGYFLIVWDIVRFCRENGILAQGRGSAANSAVCYALEITAVDPVGMELLFEARFLSEERGEWPDIDIDLPSGEKRERAIQYVYERFRKLGAAMTANVITYRGRSAAREVGKALGFEITTLERLSGLVRAWEWKDPKDTTERQFREAGFDLRNSRVRKFFELYRMAQDLPRHLGQHSGGMVICQGALDSVVPLEPATMPGRVVVQWDKEDCADLGIIKVDLLGLGMMAVIEDTLKLIPEVYGEQVDLGRLPQDDPAVFGALQKADTIGMFQVESRAQMSSLPRMMPRRFYDIVVQVAIIRPGPIVGKMVHPYLNRRQGREKPDCLHPSLEPVLRRTLGVPLFQGTNCCAWPCQSFPDLRAARQEELRAAPWGFQTLGKAHGGYRSETARRHGPQRDPWGSAGPHRAIHHVLRALRLPGIARRQFRAAGLCQRVLEVSLSGRLHVRHAEQSADGLLFAGGIDQRCAAPRSTCASGGCGRNRIGECKVQGIGSRGLGVGEGGSLRKHLFGNKYKRSESPFPTPYPPSPQPLFFSVSVFAMPRDSAKMRGGQMCALGRSPSWTHCRFGCRSCARTKSIAWRRSARSIRWTGFIAATPCGRRSAPFCRWGRCSKRGKKRARHRRWRPCKPRSGCRPTTGAPVLLWAVIQWHTGGPR